MRRFVQFLCVVVMAIGTGLLAFANRLEPRWNLADPSTYRQVSLSYEDRNQHFIAAITGGVGMGLILLGSLGLVMPLIGRIGRQLSSELSDEAARAIATGTIWLSTAAILTFGVFAVHWSGTAALCIVLLIVAFLLSAATLSSALAYGWRPWQRQTDSAPDNAVPTPEVVEPIAAK